ncbi:MAG: helix-turn-helix domain containing protein [Parvibaculaceae bacterium]|nr:helix-turn-helix domain containing protein [Parvibaculaceae bacterium]|tara:strand:+ start:61 stop:687 length:627 start_codon:yes stop_codon:yes gene_type:complete
MPAQPAPKPKQLGAEQRSAILDKAFALFARQGYRRTSFGDIAEEVGLSRPAIYHYFKNKDAVFKAVTDRIHKDISLAIERALEQPGAIEDRLLAVFEARAGRDYALLFVSPYGRELLAERKKREGGDSRDSGLQARMAMEQIIREGDDSEELALSARGMTPESTVDLLEHFFEGLLAREASEANASAAARLMVGLVVAGLRISPPSEG